MKKHASLLLQLLLSILAIGAIAYMVDFSSVVQIISHAKPLSLILALACYVCVNLLMAYRIKALLSDMGQKTQYLHVLESHFGGMLASDFTPARSGYFATAALLHTKKVPADKAVASILAPQIFDFLLKVVVGGIGIAFIFSTFSLDGSQMLAPLLAVAAVFLMVLFSILLLFSPAFLRLLKTIFSIHPLAMRIYELLHGMQEHSKAVRRKLPLVLLILATTWILKGAEWLFLADAISMEPDFAYGALLFYMVLQPLVTILQFVPFPTLAGAGLSEAGAIGVLFFFGISAPTAAAFAILTRGIMVLVDLAGLSQLRHIDLDSILPHKHF